MPDRHAHIVINASLSLCVHAFEASLTSQDIAWSKPHDADSSKDDQIISVDEEGARHNLDCYWENHGNRCSALLSWAAMPSELSVQRIVRALLCYAESIPTIRFVVDFGQHCRDVDWQEDAIALSEFEGWGAVDLVAFDNSFKQPSLPQTWRPLLRLRRGKLDISAFTKLGKGSVE